MTDYHWTPANQRAFLEALAETGSIELACKEVGMSRRAAYNLCGRREGAAFKLGWEAALLQARAVVWGTLMDRAINGQMIETVRDPETHTTRRMHYNGHMGLALLSRLEDKAKASDDAGPYAAAVRMVDNDFAAFLDLIEAGGTGAHAGLFVAARITPEEMVFPGITCALEKLQNQCELPRISADCDEDDEGSDPVQTEVDEMTVWYDEDCQSWRTNFPPPPDFDGVYETGLFGDGDYERDLSSAEEEAIETKRAAEVAPVAEAGAVARDDWFGFVPDAVEVKSAPPALAVVSGPRPEIILPEPETARELQPEREPRIDSGPPVGTIFCEPQPNYPARGIIPPWAERIY